MAAPSRGQAAPLPSSLFLPHLPLELAEPLLDLRGGGAGGPARRRRVQLVEGVDVVLGVADLLLHAAPVVEARRVLRRAGVHARLALAPANLVQQGEAVRVG